MRTLVLLVIGLVLVALFLGLVNHERRRLAALIFMGVWLTVIGWNFSLGLSHGYSLLEELPIQALLFGVPALAAWWFSRPTKNA
jgi:hypothetical protein